MIRREAKQGKSSRGEIFQVASKTVTPQQIKLIQQLEMSIVSIVWCKRKLSEHLDELEKFNQILGPQPKPSEFKKFNKQIEFHTDACIDLGKRLQVEYRDLSNLSNTASANGIVISKLNGP